MVFCLKLNYDVKILFMMLIIFIISVLINFMVTLCINRVQHLIFQVMHTTLKKRRVIKTF